MNVVSSKDFTQILDLPVERNVIPNSLVKERFHQTEKYSENSNIIDT